jgi:hypothetical protein
MPRRRVEDGWSEKMELELSSRKLVGSLPRSRLKRSASKESVLRAEEEALEMMRSKDYSGARPMHLVALWAWAHAQTYGVAPAMTSKDWSRARILASTVVEQDFEGSAEQAVAFVRWSWGEESRQRDYRVERGLTITPLGWALQFSRRHVVKWRANRGAKKA